MAKHKKKKKKEPETVLDQEITEDEKRRQKRQQQSDAIRGRLLQLAREYARKQQCPKCKEGRFTIVPLYEYGDHEIPSNIIMRCKKCGYNTSIAYKDDESARKFKRQVQGEGLQSMDERKSEEKDEDSGYKLNEHGIIVPKK